MFRILAVVLFLGVTVFAVPDPYSVLGVQRDASDDEIRRTFKKLARKMHPDQNKEKDAEQVRKAFMDLTDSYAILSDPEKRRQYDQTGGTGPSAQQDRNYLKYHLFTENFDGIEIREKDILNLMDGKGSMTTIVFFWSSNYPDCIDFAPPFRQLATKLKGSSVQVAAIKCDENVMACRRAGVHQPPSIVLFKRNSKHFEFYKEKKIDLQALVTLAAKHFSGMDRLMRFVAAPAWTQTCPDPIRTQPDLASRWPAQYLAATSRRSNLAMMNADIISFEFSPCFDCLTELQIALETISSVMPSLTVHRVDCRKKFNKEFCLEQGGKQRDRAWSIGAIEKRCWFATKKPYKFSDERCQPIKFDPFVGRYRSHELVQFIMSHQKPTLRALDQKRFDNIKKRNDASVVLYAEALDLNRDEVIQWELLNRHLKLNPLKGRKGFTTRIAIVPCKTQGSLCEGKQVPSVEIYGYGLKVKKTDPIVWKKVSGWQSMLLDLKRDCEPLHLHVLTPSTYDKKINGGLQKGKKWFVLYNAGDWCPPCNQVRPVWRELARIVQETPEAKSLSIGVVECDKYKKLCNSLGLQNYPTMAFLAKGRQRQEYNGDRDAHSMAEWAIGSLDNKLLSLHPREIHGKISNGESLVVSFTAGQWCPPCTSLGPIFKKVSNKVNTPCTVVNCDDMGHFCHNYNIDGYPTIIFFKNGQPIVYEGNRQDAAAIAKWIKLTR